MNYTASLVSHDFTIWDHNLTSLFSVLEPFRCPNSADILGKNLASLQKEFNDILADVQEEKEKAWAGQRQLQEELVSQQEKLEEIQEKYRQACIKQHKQE